MPVASPFELLDLAPGEVKTFTVLRVEEGSTTINTQHSGAKEIPVLRLHVDPADKPHGLPYYDVTSLTLQAQLRPSVLDGLSLPRRLTIQAIGAGASKRFTVGQEPA